MSGKPRIGVMGGTFDPIHHGHLAAANEAGHAFGLDEVVFVPAGQPWQKSGRRMAPAEDRYAMTVIGTASNPLFSVSRIEIDRPGDTYTIDTARALHASYGASAEIFFIIGADSLSRLRTWHEPAELLSMVHFIGLTRRGHQLTDNALGPEAFSLLEMPALEVSSTVVRSRIRAGLPIRYLVPEGVVQYIAKRGLYRDPVEP
ncbi:MAG TPA: nicotinate-nucleotide adenylyltransferase [Streptosporangiaceae bacterium]|jgi:nicotinate-nucleotide adenylyltransferase|nr:nicotinate-nucleotide adenylyltransferase [Streptosporangiaceae bacterium]